MKMKGFPLRICRIRRYSQVLNNSLQAQQGGAYG